LARREVKAETGKTKRAVIQYRHEIALLKRKVDEQQRKILRMASKQPDAQPAEEENVLEGIRFSSRSVRAQRKRLGLSALAYGKLVGVSSLTIYNWEQGKTRPRAAEFAALAALRGIGKREALKRLEQIATEGGKTRRKAR
jgi:DNA-binding transcriptional regulator YiaG